MKAFELTYVYVDIYTDPEKECVVSRILTCKDSPESALAYAKTVPDSEVISAAGMSLKNFETIGLKCTSKIYLAVSTKNYKRWLT